jgi:hypothetical protein
MCLVVPKYYTVSRDTRVYTLSPASRNMLSFSVPPYQSESVVGPLEWRAAALTLVGEAPSHYPEVFGGSSNGHASCMRHIMPMIVSQYMPILSGLRFAWTSSDGFITHAS